MACPLSEPPSGNGVPANPEIWVSVAVPVSTSVCENAGDAAPTLATAAPPSASANAVVVFNDVYLGIDSNSLRLDGRRPSVIPMDRRREPRRGFSDRSRLGRQRDCRHGATIGRQPRTGCGRYRLRDQEQISTGSSRAGRSLHTSRVVITTSGIFPRLFWIVTTTAVRGRAAASRRGCSSQPTIKGKKSTHSSPLHTYGAPGTCFKTRLLP